MDDLLACKDIDAFCKATNRTHGAEEDVYEISPKCMDKIFKIIKYIMDTCYINIFGISILPDGKDAILSIRLSTFIFSDEFELASILKNIDNVTIQPLDEHFLLKVRVNDLYRIMDESEFKYD